MTAAPNNAGADQGASQISAWPAASIGTQTNATLAPPILSGRWPKIRRPAIKVMLKTVKASQAWPQPCCAKSSTMNVVIAPKPTLLSAKPRPGTQTAPTTLVNAGRTWGADATGRRRATSSKLTSGISVVASAIAAKP